MIDDTEKVKSRDILEVYRKVYSLAKKLGDPVWTESIYRQLHLQFTNPGMSKSGNPFKRNLLCSLTNGLKIDVHYEKLFRKLKYKQEEINGNFS